MDIEFFFVFNPFFPRINSQSIISIVRSCFDENHRFVFHCVLDDSSRARVVRFRITIFTAVAYEIFDSVLDYARLETATIPPRHCSLGRL